MATLKHTRTAGHADGGPCDRRNPQAAGEDAAPPNCWASVESSLLLDQSRSHGQRFADVIDESPANAVMHRIMPTARNRIGVAAIIAGLSGMAAWIAQPQGYFGSWVGTCVDACVGSRFGSCGSCGGCGSCGSCGSCGPPCESFVAGCRAEAGCCFGNCCGRLLCASTDALVRNGNNTGKVFFISILFSWLS
ncbi:hypothetical protein OKW46_001556 [Paraburkholderia sp. WSM4179]|nr:hypothetical protein [Paraburkholderia sp. WSM4179]